jgi:hypothetical protein
VHASPQQKRSTHTHAATAPNFLKHRGNDPNANDPLAAYPIERVDVVLQSYSIFHLNFIILKL